MSLAVAFSTTRLMLLCFFFLFFALIMPITAAATAICRGMLRSIFSEKFPDFTPQGWNRKQKNNYSPCVSYPCRYKFCVPASHCCSGDPETGIEHIKNQSAHQGADGE